MYFPRVLSLIWRHSEISSSAYPSAIRLSIFCSRLIKASTNWILDKSNYEKRLIFRINTFEAISLSLVVIQQIGQGRSILQGLGKGGISFEGKGPWFVPSVSRLSADELGDSPKGTKRQSWYRLHSIWNFWSPSAPVRELQSMYQQFLCHTFPYSIAYCNR